MGEMDGGQPALLPASLPSCLSSAPGTCCQSPSRFHYQPFPLDLSCPLNLNNSQVSVTRVFLLRDPSRGSRGPDPAPETPAHRLHFQGLFIQEMKGGKWQEEPKARRTRRKTQDCAHSLPHSVPSCSGGSRDHSLIFLSSWSEPKLRGPLQML